LDGRELAISQLADAGRLMAETQIRRGVFSSSFPAKYPLFVVIFVQLKILGG
jgi:hypothetical protein